MLNLSERLMCIMNSVPFGDTVADIGTDHGQLPIYLKIMDYCPHVIMTDLKEGPIEKAKETIQKHDPIGQYDIRQGDGLAPIKPGEVDTVIIAGMGGILIRDILEKEKDKAASFKRLIFQPRNNSAILRDWLNLNGYYIIDEKLVKEGDVICEVLVASHENMVTEEGKLKASQAGSLESLFGCGYELLMEIPPMLYLNSDPLLYEFLDKKHSIEADIVNTIHEKGVTPEAEKKLMAALHRAKAIEGLYNIMADGL